MGVPSGDGTDLTLPDVVVRIRDLAGRPRGVGFLADHQGTLITAHEAVDGLPRIVLYGAGDRTCIVTSDAVTALPELDLALVHTEGLATDPLPVTVRREVPTGTYVRLAAGCWREARVLSTTPATYTATDRFHLLPHTLELAIGTTGRDALRLGGGAAGGPVLDAATGTVVAILGTALQSDHRDVGFAIPLRGAATKSAALTELLLRNAATVPAYGVDLNLAGVLELTATSVGSDGPPGALAGCRGGPGAGRRGVAAWGVPGARAVPKARETPRTRGMPGAPAVPKAPAVPESHAPD
ncbi:trypsin-like peptidase domain-containing protein, partial [Streptomyces acidiscabies]|uniref:trypsin-like peptidase domain-containing protein n=1 Tax=Streptomyces acidiscabies TaxID=42234 RepID=UPI000AA91279